MILILRTTTPNYPDWLPALVWAVLIMTVAFMSFVLSRKVTKDGEASGIDKAAFVILFVLATIGVFAMLRVII